MKILSLNSASRHIIITIPKSNDWNTYLKEIDVANQKGEVLNYKVNHLPKTSIGCKCYIVHNGTIKGYHYISSLVSKNFTCTTTGKQWSGNFIERSGPFYPIKEIPMKGFMGFKYTEDLG